MDAEDNILLLLKPVFDSCDYNKDGFVKIQDLLVLGKKHAFDNIDVRMFTIFLRYMNVLLTFFNPGCAGFGIPYFIKYAISGPLRPKRLTWTRKCSD